MCLIIKFMNYLLLTALLPVLILIIYIYRKDKKQPEPIGQIVRAFMLGLLSAPLSFAVSVPSEMIGLYSEEVYTVMDAIRVSNMSTMHRAREEVASVTRKPPMP